MNSGIDLYPLLFVVLPLLFAIALVAQFRAKYLAFHLALVTAAAITFGYSFAILLSEANYISILRNYEDMPGGFLHHYGESFLENLISPLLVTFLLLFVEILWLVILAIKCYLRRKRDRETAKQAIRRENAFFANEE